MKLKLQALVLLFTFLLVFIAKSSAHNTAIEKQVFYRTKSGQIVIRKKPSRKGNASFKKPFKLPWSVQTSMSIFAYLDAGDVDVYEFQLNGGDGKNSPEGINDYQQSMQLFNSTVPVVFANALPPACKETANDFPAVGLVVPRYGSTTVPLFEDPKAIGLNFSIPKGYAIHAVFNPPPDKGEKRLIFEQPEEPGEEPLNLKWFLPKGCFYNGVPSPYTLNCFNSKSLFAPVHNPFVPYYIVAWNPAGKAIDYTMNIGIDERFTVDNVDVEAAVRNNGYLHQPCTPP